MNIEQCEAGVLFLQQLWERLLPDIEPTRGPQQFAMWWLQSRGDVEMVTDAFEATAKKNAALNFEMSADHAGRFTTFAINSRRDRVIHALTR